MNNVFFHYILENNFQIFKKYLYHNDAKNLLCCKSSLYLKDDDTFRLTKIIEKPSYFRVGGLRRHPSDLAYNFFMDIIEKRSIRKNLIESRFFLDAEKEKKLREKKLRKKQSEKKRHERGKKRNKRKKRK